MVERNNKKKKVSFLCIATIVLLIFFLIDCFRVGIENIRNLILALLNIYMSVPQSKQRPSPGPTELLNQIP